MSSESGPEQRYSAWLDTIGWKVHELLREEGTIERFREMILAWKVERDSQWAEHRVWEQQRHEYFTQTISGDRRLQDERAGPPGENWKYEPYFWREDGRCPVPLELLDRMKVGSWLDTAHELGSIRLGKSAWCPPELSISAEPPRNEPLSFCDCSPYRDPDADPDRSLTLPEKYAVCAAIHDAVCTGVEKINPWAEQEAIDPYFRLRTAYDKLCENVLKLHEADRNNVEAFLGDIMSDLTALSATKADPTPEREGASSESLHVFRRRGAIWEVRFGPDDSGMFPLNRGFAVIHQLLCAPDPSKGIDCMTLMGLDPEKAETQSFQSVADSEAMRDMKRRCEDLQDLMSQAQESGALAKLHEYQQERSRLAAELQQAIGLAGRSGRLGPAADAERAREGIRKALLRAYSRMEQAVPPLPKLVDHLRRSIQPDCNGYAYRPAVLPDWQTT
jgi:hypothetical protein